jgi:hypothetical protein
LLDNVSRPRKRSAASSDLSRPGLIGDASKEQESVDRLAGPTRSVPLVWWGFAQESANLGVLNCQAVKQTKSIRRVFEGYHAISLQLSEIALNERPSGVPTMPQQDLCQSGRRYRGSIERERLAAEQDVEKIARNPQQHLAGRPRDRQSRLDIRVRAGGLAADQLTDHASLAAEPDMQTLFG